MADAVPKLDLGGILPPPEPHRWVQPRSPAKTPRGNHLSSAATSRPDTPRATALAPEMEAAVRRAVREEIAPLLDAMQANLLTQLRQVVGSRGKEAAAADGTVGPTATRNETQLLRWEVARLETTLNNMRALIPGLTDIPPPADAPLAAVVAESAAEASPSVSSIHEAVSHAAAHRADPYTPGNGDFSSGESSDGSVQSPEKPPAGASDRRRGGDGGLNSGGRGSPRHSTELQSGQYQSGNETSTSTVMSGQSGRGQDPTWLSYKSLLGIRTKGRKRSDTHRSNSSKGRQQRRFMFRSTDPDVDGGEGGSDSDNSERGGYSSSLGALTPRALPTDWRRTFHSAVRASYHYVRGDRLAAPVRQTSECQDIAVVVKEFGGHAEVALMGVFKGHGPHGRSAAQLVASRLPVYLASHRSLFTGDMARRRAVITAAVGKAHKKTLKELDASVSGCTACVVILGPQRLTVANVGHSRAMMVQYREDGSVHANVLTSRHCPEFPDEVSRIVNLGGEVRQTGGAGPWRVYKRGESTPGLDVSRSLGDKAAHKLGVTAVPDVRELRLTTRDFLCVVGTAGLWEAFSPQEAAEWLWKFAMLRRHGIDLGVALATEAEHRWRAAHDDVLVDDIACTVVQLQSLPNSEEEAAAGALSAREQLLTTEDDSSYIGFRFVPPTTPPITA